MTAATRNQRDRGVEVRSVVSRELADRLREMATKENRTLSAMIALLLARAVEKE
jgi:CopG-like RHH_1 or ribbon-helix-helix domain, RHH_5